MYHWTDHAKDRWRERFFGIDPHLDLANTTNVGKKLRKRIKDLCPKNAAEYMGKQFSGRYCRVSKSNIVYVIKAPEVVGGTPTVITVFHLYSDSRKSGGDPFDR